MQYLSNKRSGIQQEGNKKSANCDKASIYSVRGGSSFAVPNEETDRPCSDLDLHQPMPVVRRSYRRPVCSRRRPRSGPQSAPAEGEMGGR